MCRYRRVQQTDRYRDTPILPSTCLNLRHHGSTSTTVAFFSFRMQVLERLPNRIHRSKTAHSQGGPKTAANLNQYLGVRRPQPYRRPGHSSGAPSASTNGWALVIGSADETLGIGL